MKNKIKESISGELKSVKSSWVFNNKLLIITFILIYFHTQGYVFGERHLRTSRDVECLVGDCKNGQGVGFLCAKIIRVQSGSSLRVEKGIVEPNRPLGSIAGRKSGNYR